MTPEDFIKQYLNATKTHDWANVEPLVHPNAAVTFSTGEVHEGRGAVQKAFERNFERIQNEKYTMSNIRWLLQNETTAVCLFNYAWQGKVYGQYAEGHGVGTLVLWKEKVDWQLLTEQHCRV